jgi:hypothetical protein
VPPSGVPGCHYGVSVQQSRIDSAGCLHITDLVVTGIAPCADGPVLALAVTFLLAAWLPHLMESLTYRQREYACRAGALAPWKIRRGIKSDFHKHPPRMRGFSATVVLVPMRLPQYLLPASRPRETITAHTNYITAWLEQKGQSQPVVITAIRQIYANFQAPSNHCN